VVVDVKAKHGGDLVFASPLFSASRDHYGYILSKEKLEEKFGVLRPAFWVFFVEFVLVKMATA